MWPFSRRAPAVVLRAGRASVECWERSSGGLELRARAEIPGGRSRAAKDLAAAIDGVPREHLAGLVGLVLESVWLPVILVDTGSAPLARESVARLARHHLGSLYGSAADPIGHWDVRVDHRAGDRFALAYGLSGQLKEVLLALQASAGIAWSSIEPAFDWGRRHFSAVQPKRKRNGWWVWCEQDRTLIARLGSSSVQGLHPGLACADSIDAILAGLDAEEVRLGLTKTSDPIGIGCWGSIRPSQAPDRRVAWHVVAAAPEASGAAATTSIGDQMKPKAVA